MTDPVQDRRRFHRIVTDKTVTVQHGDAMLHGVVRDISLKGLLITLNVDLPPGLAMGTAIRADVELGGEFQRISCDGEVAHLAGRQIGMRCLGMDLDSAARLRRLVELNLADPELLKRDLAELVSD